MMVRLALALLLGSAFAPLAQAHPHVFVDTDLRFEANAEGRVDAVEVTWRYDDFFTLLIFEDMGLDPDGDGVLTPEELGRLKGFDLEVWPEGFEGDLYLFSQGEKIEMPRPVPLSVAVEEGRIVATHRRAIPPVPADGLEILEYDPTYYVDYAVQDPVIVSGLPCEARIARADEAAAAEAVEEELGRIPEDIFDEMRVGIHYADRVMLTCASPFN